MESTRPKNFNAGYIILSLSTVLFVILLVYHAFVYAGQFKSAKFTDGYTIKLRKTVTKSNLTIRPVSIDVPEPAKKKNKPDQPFSQ